MMQRYIVELDTHEANSPSVVDADTIAAALREQIDRTPAPVTVAVLQTSETPA